MVFVDIHELKQNQQALQKERNFISAILDAAKALLVVIVDSEGRIVQFNRACQELTGYSAEEVKGRRIWDFLLVPQEIAAVKAGFKDLADGITRQRENYWITKGGDRRLIAWSNDVVLGAAGAVEAMIAPASMPRNVRMHSIGPRKARPRSRHCWRPRRRRL
jgi:PAS domain S-box-containing protein